MRQNIEHVDGLIWVCHPETMQENIERLEQLTGSSFAERYSNDRFGAYIYVCAPTGMHVMAPMRGTSARLAQALAARLEAHGEGVFAVLYGVADIAAATARIRRLGYEPSELMLGTPDGPWAAEVGKMRGIAACQVLGTTFIYAEVEYHDHVFSVEGSSPQTTRYNNRLDHVAWVCFPDNFARNLELLSGLGGTPLDGPHDKPEIGIRIAISWETGLELISPVRGSEAEAAVAAKQILERGEGIYAVLFGVDDMQAALRRARSAGYTPGTLIQGGSDPNVPWAGKYKTFLESHIGKIMNTDFMYCFVEYPKTKNASRDKGNQEKS
jgi:hypothetical protein